MLPSSPRNGNVKEASVPVYQFGTIGIQLEDDQRERLAKGITQIHSEETKAPEPFIRVVFLPIPEGFGYTAGVKASSVIVNGGIRAGRSQETREAILHRIHELVLEEIDIPAGKVVVSTMDLPSEWLMEAGLMMPQPNPEEEEAWFKRLEEAGSIAESRI
jgi:phenylpyruvate tautomerase PptA (4-oxalocrotonate tautomerase family)